MAAEPIAVNQTWREKGALAHTAVKALQSAVDSACMPGGGVKGDWSARITAAQATADAACTAFIAAIGAATPAAVPPAAVYTPATGYGSYTGGPGVAVAPNP